MTRTSLILFHFSTAKAPLFGTMRHELFEATMREKDFSIKSASMHLQQILRRNSEGLLACGTTSREAEQEVMKMVPQLQQFATDFTVFGQCRDKKALNQLAVLEPQGAQPSVRLVANSVEAIEEPVISPQLGLKGNVDMIIRATTAPADTSNAKALVSLVGIELKTGHNQRTQNAHMAQLALYTLMMQSRYGWKASLNSKTLGCTSSGMLLYMNDSSFRAVHILPLMSEIKSLIGQRNVVANESMRVSRPRGVVLSYENELDSSNRVPRYVDHLIS